MIISNMKKFFGNGSRGFTLIELLVSIAIIAILTGIITANFSSARAKSRDAKRVSDIANIQLALTLYFDRCNSYPYNLQNINTPGSICPSVTLGDFISRIPTPPSDGTGQTQYLYNVKYDLLDYHIGAILEKPNSVLTDDADFDSCVDTSDPSGGWTGYGTYGNGVTVTCFPGTDPIYDLTSK